MVFTPLDDAGRLDETRVAEHLGIHKKPGDELTTPDVDALLTFYEGLLEAAAFGRPEAFAHPIARLHEQVPFRPPELVDLAVTFSGGVGELLYAHLQGKPWP